MSLDSPSLLQRVQDPADKTAWNDLVGLYSPILVRFARTQGMRHDDAEDIAVTVLEQWRKEIADWEFSAGLGKLQAHLRERVMERAGRFERVRRQRRQMGDVPRLPKQQHFSPQAAFQWLWTQEHIWYCLNQLDAPATEQWQLARQVQDQMGLLTHLSPAPDDTSSANRSDNTAANSANVDPAYPLGTLRRQIEQAGPYPEKRLVDPYADPLPTGWIPGLITLAEIGRGEQGVSYLAVHEYEGTKVMVKVFHRRYADDPHRRSQIENAVQHAQSLHHAHLVPIFGMGLCQNGQLYVAMKHLAGCTLEQALNGGLPGLPQPSEQQRLRWIRQACDAVCHAHQHGLLHLGLHARNIVIDANQEACVVDFGLPSIHEADANADALTDLGALATLLRQCLDPTSSSREPDSLDGSQRAGLRAMLRQCDNLRQGSIYRAVDLFHRDLLALENRREVRARYNDKLFRLQRFARQRMVSAVLLALVLAFAFQSHQVANGGRRAKLEAAEQVAGVRNIVNQVFAGLQRETMRSLQPQSSQLQLQRLAQRYLDWLVELPNTEESLRLDIAGMLLLIAEAQIQTTEARQADSPSALLTLGEVHEAIPSEFKVAEPWTAELDRAADLRTRAWLLADEVYRRRNRNLDVTRRQQCLERAMELGREERRLWTDKPSSLLRRLRVELAWMRYHVDNQQWPKARTSQQKLAQLLADWLPLRDAEQAPIWLRQPLEQISLHAAKSMLARNRNDLAWPWLWRQVLIEKQLGQEASAQIQLLLHQISVQRAGREVEGGPNWSPFWRWLHAAIATHIGVSKSDSGP